MRDASLAVTIADVRAAAPRIAGIAWRTPLIRSAWLSEVSGATVWLKLESVQHTGSFKIRGAANAILQLRETRPDVRAVVTASAGNHGVALATAASLLSIRARIHLPKTAPITKRQAIERLGAEVRLSDTYDAAERSGYADAERSGTVYISPYDHPDVIAGAATAALEMFEDQSELDTLIVPLGGGGLLAGAAIVARDRAARVTVIGAEASASPVFTAALAAGAPTRVAVTDTLADGLAGNMAPKSMTFPLVRDLVDRVEHIPETSIARAMRELILRDRIVGEGAAATAVGALLDSGRALEGRRVGVILSGSNVDAATIEHLFHRR